MLIKRRVKEGLGKKSISVVLPIFSEENVLYQVVRGLLQNLGPYAKEIIAIVSPKSSRKTIEICKDLKKRHGIFRYEIQKINPGLGNGVRQGLSAARGDYVLMIDSDNEMDVSSVKPMVEMLKKGDTDLIVASRWIRPNSIVGYDKVKYVINYLFQKFIKALFWLKISDCTLGYKIMKRKYAKGIKWNGTLHEIAIETTLRPIIYGARYSEVPTRWVCRTSGVSKNSWKNNFRYLKMSISLLTERIIGIKIL